MLIEEANRLLESGYLNTETGYSLLENGQMYVAVLTRLSKCKKEWIKWYFKTYIIENSEITESGSYNEQKNVPPGSNSNFTSINPYSINFIRGRLLSFKVLSCDPFQYFDKSKLEKSEFLVAYCGQSFFPDGTEDAHIIHLVRDTEEGCEIRSRYWINSGTEEAARVRMEHCINDMEYLSKNLSSIIKEGGYSEKDSVVKCKYCNSYSVVKNGFRKGSQYWVCKNCKRGFVNNQALPKMKYPFDVMTKAVYDYYSGYPINKIRQNIENEMNVYPSNSTIYRWIFKMRKLVSDQDKIISKSEFKNNNNPADS